MADKPVEIFCPICGFTAPVKDDAPEFAGLSRAERVEKIKIIQKSDHPLVECDGCDNAEASAEIMEVR
jgi:hypothetical protein